MRRLVVTLLAAMVVLSGCTSGSDSSSEPTPAASTEPAISLASLDIDWPRAADTLEVAKPPAAPNGFDDAVVTQMADILAKWAQATTIDQDVWRSATPIDEVAAVLPAKVGTTLRSQVTGTVSPRLAVANVFAEDATVIGAPQVTTAWKISTQTDEVGKQYVLLELQTRAAYEVRLGDGAPTRVIGMLRVHGLSAYADTTDDFGVTGGWQEFGASDCALALDDDLIPDTDLDETVKGLKTFVQVGNGEKLSMPTLPVEEQVDSEYLQRCRNSAT